jgi:hypothetical protein
MQTRTEIRAFRAQRKAQRHQSACESTQRSEACTAALAQESHEEPKVVSVQASDTSPTQGTASCGHMKPPAKKARVHDHGATAANPVCTSMQANSLASVTTTQQMAGLAVRSELGQLPHLPKGFFDEKAEAAHAVGRGPKVAAVNQAEPAAIEQLQREVDHMEQQHAEAEAAIAQETAARQLALEQYELQCVSLTAEYYAIAVGFK